MDLESQRIREHLRKAPAESLLRLESALAEIRKLEAKGESSWLDESDPWPAFPIGSPFYLPEVRELTQSLYDAHAIFQYPWMEWRGARNYAHSDDLLAAPIADVVRFVTAMVRLERFSAGSLRGYLRDGKLLVGATRIHQWLEEQHKVSAK